MASYRAAATYEVSSPSVYLSFHPCFFCLRMMGSLTRILFLSQAGGAF